MKHLSHQQWPELLQQLEKSVVEGQHGEVKKTIHKINPTHVPPRFAAPLAELAWRISEPLITLKLLNHIMFPENEFSEGPNDREKFIYATALGNLGAVNEALKIFDSIDSKKEPEVWLRKSLAQFRVWNYPAAIPLLENFLSQQNLPPYRHVIGQVNLAAALVTNGQYEQAAALLKAVQTECETNNYLLLLGNCLELQAQIHFFQQNYEKSMAQLNQSLALLRNQGGEFYLYSEKWKVICEAFQNPQESSLVALQAFRQKALDSSHWEIVRDCDLFEAVLRKDEILARKVILGTPYDFFRQRARRLLGQKILPQGYFHLCLGSATQDSDAFLFDPYQVQDDKEGLHSKPQLLALFEALTMDFYKPSHIGLLFQRIYKEEKFNPFSSPKRVLSLIKRLDDWFQEHRVPLRVRMKKSEFGLISENGRPVKILIQRAKTLSKQEGNLSYLRDSFKDRSFSSQHVSEKLSISRASAQTLINQAIEQGHITKHGTGRGTTYALVPRNRKKVAA